MSKKILVFTATYNEADNIERLVIGIHQALPDADVLVVDDNSPDGTGKIIDRMAHDDARLKVMHRFRKLGLGSAHKIAMQYMLYHGYEYLITMDADFSHDPVALPIFIEKLKTFDFVIGSRYAKGGRCDYGFNRMFISLSANHMARALLGIPLKEATTSYRGFTRALIEQLMLYRIKADGYSFFVESIFYVVKSTRHFTEFPIRFHDRKEGISKIARKEIYKGVFTVFRLFLKRLFRLTRMLPVSVYNYRSNTRCAICGEIYHAEMYPASSKEGWLQLQCTSARHNSHGRIVKCLNCGLVFVDPQPSHKELLDTYSKVEDTTYLENIVARLRTFEYNLAAIKPLLPSQGRLLEVGSYCGGFLSVAAKYGYDVVGLEPSAWAARAAEEMFHLRTVCGTFENLSSKESNFDIIISWDVLEHVADPQGFMQNVSRRLKPGGVFAFSTLDINNWYPRLMGKRWPWMIDMHLYYFNEPLIAYMLERAGFKMTKARNYCHIISLEYFFAKLKSLNVWGAAFLSRIVPRKIASNIYIPFRFGDIKLFVAKKME
jgi:glycosyltransferase involved in cell wall biosynthesis/2-polyprenyl-3-methyl-5-hydroxy-6-metoxy-1,4-benzoquinol methylase